MNWIFVHILQIHGCYPQRKEGRGSSSPKSGPHNTITKQAGIFPVLVNGSCLNCRNPTSLQWPFCIVQLPINNFTMKGLRVELIDCVLLKLPVVLTEIFGFCLHTIKQEEPPPPHSLTHTLSPPLNMGYLLSISISCWLPLQLVCLWDSPL